MTCVWVGVCVCVCVAHVGTFFLCLPPDWSVFTFHFPFSEMSATNVVADREEVAARGQSKPPPDPCDSAFNAYLECAKRLQESEGGMTAVNECEAEKLAYKRCVLDAKRAGTLKASAKGVKKE